MKILRRSGGKGSGERAGYRNDEVPSIVDGVPRSIGHPLLATAQPICDASDETSSRSSSTASWDFADSPSATCSTGMQTDGEEAKSNRTIARHVKELEEEIVSLREQLSICKTELVDKNLHLCCKNTGMEDLTTKLEVSMAESADLRRQILDYQVEIQELVTCLLAGGEEGEEEDQDDVTARFYEAEEEIGKLREEKNNACDIIREILGVHTTLTNGGFYDSENPVATFNMLMMGSDSLDIQGLKELAQRFALGCIDGDKDSAVAFLANVDSKDASLFDSQADPVVEKCMETVRLLPGYFLCSGQAAYLSPDCMKAILKDPRSEANELLLFEIMHRWYLADTEKRQRVCQELIKHIKLEQIHPSDLSTIVRPSGLVSDAMLCDAFGKQAANKELYAESSVSRAFISSDMVSSTECLINDNVSRGYQEVTGEVFSADDAFSTQWKTLTLSSRVFPSYQGCRFLIQIEEAGEIIFGLTNADYDIEGQSIAKFGSFLPRRRFSKGQVISFVLSNANTYGARVDGKWWVSGVDVSGHSGVLLTASLRHGASVKFLGYYKL